MGEDERSFKVKVLGKPQVVRARRSSRTVWIAAGDYNGEWIEVKASSAAAAVKQWVDTATYRGN